MPKKKPAPKATTHTKAKARVVPTPAVATAAPKAKPHLSASQLDLFSRCPEAWRRRYIEGHRRPPNVAVLRGKAVHASAKVNFQQKIASHQDLPAQDIIDVAVEMLRAEARGGYELNAEEQAIGKKKVMAATLDSTAEFAAVHATQQAPDYQPVAVERSFTIALPGPRDVIGFIDVLDDCDRVTDFKNGKRRFSQAEVDGNVQLTVYAAARRQETGRFPTLVQIDALVELTSSVKRTVVSSDRGPADMNALAARIDVVSATIDAGLFPPAPPGSWWCSPKWCGYWRDCPYVNGSRKQGD